MDFTEQSMRTMHPKCTEALKKMRRIYFPTMEFRCCRVYRGVIDQNLKSLVEHEQPVAVFMWKKSAKQKKIYTAALDDIDLAAFQAKPWSIVVMYNLVHGGDSRPTRKPTYFDEPVSTDRPSGMDTDDHDMGPPPRQDTPTYSDPDKPVPPAPDRPSRDRSRSRDRSEPPVRIKKEEPPPDNDLGGEEVERQEVERRERSRSRDAPQPISSMRSRREQCGNDHGQEMDLHKTRLREVKDHQRTEDEAPPQDPQSTGWPLQRKTHVDQVRLCEDPTVHLQSDQGILLSKVSRNQKQKSSQNRKNPMRTL